MLRFHAQTAGSTLTAQQPENNIVRVTLQALAAVLGGTQSLHTNSMDEALALPTEEAVTIALRTQQIIAYESGVRQHRRSGGRLLRHRVDDVGHRAAGPRDHGRHRAQGRRRQSDRGGLRQQQIAESAYRHQMEVESGRRGIVGVNRYADAGAGPSGGGPAAPAWIPRWRRSRPRGWPPCAPAVTRRERAAPCRHWNRPRADPDNLLPFILEAVESRATLGEIADRLRAAFSAPTESLALLKGIAMASDSSAGWEYLLEVRGLRTSFLLEAGVVRAADDVSFRIAPGEVLALVGESGCGKSVTALSLMRLVQPPGRIVGGEILFKGRDLLSLTEKQMCGLRGKEMGFVFQEPAAALNPVFTIGYQVGESLMIHKGLSRKEARREAVKMLEEVSVPDPARRVLEYPHQLSGGLRQRVMIAMALICRPDLLIADEPTTALDVTIQAQILDLLRRLRDKRGLAVLLITHDLGVVAELADRVAVMYAGKIVEAAGVRDLFASPNHPYTRGLMKSIPRRGAGGGAARPRLQAIDGVVPDMLRLPSGCSFHPRCPDVMAQCRGNTPALLPAPPGETPRRVACYLHAPLPEPPPPVEGRGWDAASGR